MGAPSLQGRARLGNPVHLLALGFGSGLSPWAPGTMGTVAAIPIWWLLSQLPLAGYLAATALACVIGIWICERAANDFGVHDHPAIVWDEIAGFLITMILAPTGLLWVLVGFVLFRAFDIIKPWPIGWVDRHVGGGFGIMIDDVIAGVYAACVLQIVVRLI